MDEEVTDYHSERKAKRRLQKDMEELKEEKATLDRETERLEQLEVQINAGISHIRRRQLPPVSKKHNQLRASNEVLRTEVKELVEQLEKVGNSNPKKFSKSIEDALVIDRSEKIQALRYEMDHFDETMASLQEMRFVSDEESTSDSETKVEESATTDRRIKSRNKKVSTIV